MQDHVFGQSIGRLGEKNWSEYLDALCSFGKEIEIAKYLHPAFRRDGRCANNQGKTSGRDGGLGSSAPGPARRSHIIPP
jgi:hypothetical protein